MRELDERENVIVQAFLAERRSGIGGTDAAVIAGVSSFKRPLQLFYEKRGELPDFFAKSAEGVVRWGKLLEPVVRKHYAEVTGRLVRRAPFVKHKLFPFLVGHPDGFVWRDKVRGILEVKTAFFTKRREWEESGVPDAYYLQAQHYLGITGCAFASFAVLFGGSEFEFFDVARDQRIIDLLFAAEVEFWERIQANDPPSPTFDDKGTELARALYPQADAARNEVILDSDEAKARMEQYLRLKAGRASIDEKMGELETWLMYQLGDAERAFIPGLARVKWSNGSRRSVNYKKFEKDYAEAYAAVVAVKDSRTMRVKDIRGVKDADVDEERQSAERTRRKIKTEDL